MFLLSEPDDALIRTMLDRQRLEDFSYPALGGTQGQLPGGYAMIHDRVDLGRGSATFVRAVEALCRWEMFRVPGVRLCWPDVPIEAGKTVAILIKHFGFWSLNFCRIVYVLDEESEGPVRRYGFAYGTLPEHAEQGEERFTIEWHRPSDVVSYDILSFSRPGHVMTRLAYPVARRMQRRFVRHSLAAMVGVVQRAD